MSTEDSISEAVDSEEPFLASPVRRGGPGPHRRVPGDQKFNEGLEVIRLRGEGLTYEEVAARLGSSATTCWRRAWWVWDVLLPVLHGGRRAPLTTPMRGTARCPAGRPLIESIDGVAQ